MLDEKKKKKSAALLGTLAVGKDPETVHRKPPKTSALTPQTRLLTVEMASSRRGRRMPYPVLIEKGDFIPSAASLYAKLQASLPPDKRSLMNNYKDIRKPNPSVHASFRGYYRKFRFFGCSF